MIREGKSDGSPPGRAEEVPGLASREWTDKAPDRRHGQVGQEGGRHRPGALGLTDLSVGDLRLLLNGEWEFAEGPDGAPPAAGWGRVGCPTAPASSRTIPPPRAGTAPPSRFPPTGRPGTAASSSTRGGSATSAASISTATPIGEHHGMRLPWRLDLTSLVDPGSVHELLLFTHNCTGPYAHPRETSLSEDALRPPSTPASGARAQPPSAWSPTST